MQEGPTASVPLHLRSTGYQGASQLGHGVEYVYPHGHPEGVVAQQYFPDGVDAAILFQPGDLGDEASIKARLAAIDRVLGRTSRE